MENTLVEVAEPVEKRIYMNISRMVLPCYLGSSKFFITWEDLSFNNRVAVNRFFPPNGHAFLRPEED